MVAVVGERDVMRTFAMRVGVSSNTISYIALPLSASVSAPLRNGVITFRITSSIACLFFKPCVMRVLCPVWNMREILLQKLWNAGGVSMRKEKTFLLDSCLSVSRPSRRTWKVLRVARKESVRSDEKRESFVETSVSDVFCAMLLVRMVRLWRNATTLSKRERLMLRKSAMTWRLMLWKRFARDSMEE